MIRFPAAYLRSSTAPLGLLAAIAILLGHAAPARASEIEGEVKVEFIERFTEFVEWPAEAFASKTSEFNVCTVGDGPLAPRIGALLGKTRIKDRPVRVRALKPGEGASGCHLLYIAPSESGEVDRIVRQLGKSPVLTIGDKAGFGKRGVLINLFLEGSHLRFAINAAASKANGLNVSVKLLVLARPEEGARQGATGRSVRTSGMHAQWLARTSRARKSCTGNTVTFAFKG